MRFGSLFSGIGGLDLGLERAGLTCAWQCETDPFCRAVLAKHWPTVPKYGDIREVDWDGVAHVGLICGGFPCQPVSAAGNGLAQADDRWLWPEFAHAVGRLRPAFVLVENVSGLLSRGMCDVLGDLAALGYDADWSIVSACAVGAPHTRERVFIVAYADSQYGQAWLGDRKENERSLSAIGDRAGKSCWVDSFPGVCGVVDGVPGRVDRLRALGNAVVPHLAEWIGRRLMASLEE